MGRVIAAPQERIVQGRRKGPQAVASRRVLRERSEVEAIPEADGGYNRGRRRAGLRLTFRGGLPETMTGRVVAGITALALLGAAAAFSFGARRMMLHDQRFVVPGPSAIETSGTQRLSRSELLHAFDGDIGRNVFSLSLERQRAQLEAIPWVQRATVMRLLPDHLRANVVERVPIAFVREKGKIGLVDGGGVLLDLRQGSAGASYSFPVVTGILADDPLPARSARMKLFSQFVAALDATGEHISAKLSEVDLSNPEDVKALIPDSGAEMLVHFGDTDFLERFRKYEAHLPEWRQQYPKLAGVDMRYDRQAVLQMQPGSTVPVNSSPAESSAVESSGSVVAVTSRLGGPRHAASHAAVTTARGPSPHNAPAKRVRP